MVSDKALDAWITRSWDGEPPPWDRSVFRELHEAEVRETAQAKAESVEAKKVAQLEAENRRLAARLARIEKTLGPGGKMLAKQFSGAIADALPRVLDRHLEHRRTMTYRGTWDADTSYVAGSTVTHAGAVWCALQSIPKGTKPGHGETGWRLAAKGEQKGPTVR